MTVHVNADGGTGSRASQFYRQNEEEEKEKEEEEEDEEEDFLFFLLFKVKLYLHYI